MRHELKVTLDERDYARAPLSVGELKSLFAGRDPREFLNHKSSEFKAMGLAGQKLTAGETLSLMAKEPNLIKRPLTIANGEIVVGFDRERLRTLLSQCEKALLR